MYSVKGAHTKVRPSPINFQFMIIFGLRTMHNVILVS